MNKVLYGWSSAMGHIGGQQQWVRRKKAVIVVIYLIYE